MNKPIINGIDVSECKYYKDNGKCRIPHYQQGIKYVSCNCNEWDCIYKQLKRLQEENKELKEINTALIQEAEDVAEARMEICNQCGNRDDYNIPCKMIRDLDYGLNITIEERDSYRSALEEIREIVTGNYEVLGPQAKKDIEYKINEVLSEND